MVQCWTQISIKPYHATTAMLCQSTDRESDATLCKWILWLPSRRNEGVIVFYANILHLVIGDVEAQDDLPVVLAPPGGECIVCGRRLVSNHCTEVKYYAEGGLSYADKITLHCVDCKLFYNLT